MQDNLKKVGAKVYLSDEILIQKVTYVYENGTESKPLSRFVHLGMYTDSILFGEECQIRFFVYPNSIKLYDTDVNCLEFINNANRACGISCFDQQTTLSTSEHRKFVNSGNRNFKLKLKTE